MTNEERKDFLAAFGRNVQKIRIEKGMTLEELANKIGYETKSSRTAMYKIEAGIMDPSASKIYMISQALGVSPAELMDWDATANFEAIQAEIEIGNTIADKYGKDNLQILSGFFEEHPDELRKLEDLLTGYSRLNESDRAELRGRISQKIEDFLSREGNGST